MFQQVGNHVERKKLLLQTLELEKQQGNDCEVAQTLRYLSGVNRLLNLHEEGIRQAQESLEIFIWIGETVGQANSLNDLAWLLFDAGQPDAAEESASRAIDLVSE